MVTDPCGYNIFLYGMSEEDGERFAGSFDKKIHIYFDDNRESALAYIKNSEEKPEVVLIDCDHADGCDIFVESLNEIGVQPIPFIILTSGMTSDEENNWMALGACDIIPLRIPAKLIQKRVKNVADAARSYVYQRKLHRERLIRDSMIHGAISFFEADITSDSIIAADAETLAFASERGAASYSALVSALASKNTVGEYSHLFISRLRAEKLIACYAEGQNTIVFEYSKRQGSARCLWYEVCVYLTCDDETSHILALCRTNDVSNQKQNELTLRDMAERDPLTELYNRSAFELLVERTLAENQMVGDTAAFYMLDIDNFKMINDSFGHDFGDDVLVKIGKILKSVFRSCDYVARLGGDEYAVLIPKVVSRSVILRRADDICRALSIDITKSGGVRRISCSVGIAFAPDNGCDFRTLYKNADTALYDAKSMGKNCYAVYNE